MSEDELAIKVFEMQIEWQDHVTQKEKEKAFIQMKPNILKIIRFIKNNSKE